MGRGAAGPRPLLYRASSASLSEPERRLRDANSIGQVAARKAVTPALPFDYIDLSYSKPSGSMLPQKHSLLPAYIYLNENILFNK